MPTKRCTAAVERFAVDPRCRPLVIADVSDEKTKPYKAVRPESKAARMVERFWFLG